MFSAKREAEVSRLKVYASLTEEKTELSKEGIVFEVLKAADSNDEEMEEAIQEKKTYVEMLEKLLQFRLQQRQGLPV